MAKRDKRLQSMRQNPRNVTYNDLIAVLSDIGFEVREGKGSHVIARHQIEEQIWTFVFPRPHGRSHVKRIYIVQILQIIDEIEAVSGDVEDDEEE